jgi:uncharacterized protein
MASRTKLYFATDIHGSETCFRKFLNAGAAYRPDVMVLGGDVAGKAIQAIERCGGGRFTTTFRGARHEVREGDELSRLERTISDLGYYPWRAEPGELDQRVADGTVEQLLMELMTERLERWLAMADERLRPLGKRVFWMLGNDDPPELEQTLANAPWGEHAEGRMLALDDAHSLISWGWSNKTPWDSYREMSEHDLSAHFDQLFGGTADSDRVVFNCHVPPFESGLDEAPMLDKDLTVRQQAGQVRLGPVGSTAVREAIERYQPVVSLHGHVHESAGFRRIGATTAVNPGSDYGTGALNGALLTLSKDKLASHQLVRG